MNTNESLYDERNTILTRIVTCQGRHAQGERGPQIEAEYHAAVTELQAFDVAHPEIKREVRRRLLAYHAKRQPFAPR